MTYSLTFESFGVLAEVATDDREIFEELASALPPVWRPVTGEVAEHRFEAMRDGAVRLNGRVIAHTDGRRRRTLAMLAARLRDHLAVQSPLHVFVHAGVVCHEGSAIIVPGRSFSGKTTLVARLVEEGAIYYSDEYAVVDGAGMIHPFPKPLSLRIPGSRRFALPARLPESQIGTAPIPAGLIVITGYEPGASWRPKALSPAEAVLALLQHTIPVRARPRQALHAACHLARAAPAVSGPRGEASDIACELLALAGGRVAA